MDIGQESQKGPENQHWTESLRCGHWPGMTGMGQERTWKSTLDWILEVLRSEINKIILNILNIFNIFNIFNIENIWTILKIFNWRNSYMLGSSVTFVLAFLLHIYLENNIFPPYTASKPSLPQKWTCSWAVFLI